MAKKYFNRYVWLIDTIKSHGHITFNDLSDLWRRSSLNEDGTYLPKRTFFNHREAIADIFGVEIKYDKTLGYYISSDSEDFSSVRQWLLTSLSVYNLINEDSAIRERIIFEDIPSGANYLPIIIEAIKCNSILEMTYQKFQDNEPKTYDVAPYCIKVFKQRWYMVAKIISCGEVRVYSLDRILNLKCTDRNFVFPSNYIPDEYFANYFGIVHDEQYPVQKIRLKVYDKQRHYFRTLPLHKSQTEVEETPQWSIFEYTMAPTWDLEQELLQYNDQVKVLEPKCLRNMIIEHAWNILHEYKEA